MKKILILVLSTVLLSILCSCATTGVFIEESNYSVKQHRIAATLALGRVREVSRNGRVVTSDYHDDKFETIETTNKTKERYYTKVSVLGSIRPYRVSVEVLLEQRDPDTRAFAVVATDENLSLKRAKAVQQLLNQSRDPLTTFDEENPF